MKNKTQLKSQVHSRNNGSSQEKEEEDERNQEVAKGIEKATKCSKTTQTTDKGP